MSHLFMIIGFRIGLFMQYLLLSAGSRLHHASITFYNSIIYSITHESSSGNLDNTYQDIDLIAAYTLCLPAHVPQSSHA